MAQHGLQTRLAPEHELLLVAVLHFHRKAIPQLNAQRSARATVCSHKVFCELHQVSRASKPHDKLHQMRYYARVGWLRPQDDWSDVFILGACAITSNESLDSFAQLKLRLLKVNLTDAVLCGLRKGNKAWKAVGDLSRNNVPLYPFLHACRVDRVVLT